MAKRNKGKRKSAYSRLGVTITVLGVFGFYLIFFFIMALLERMKNL